MENKLVKTMIGAVALTGSAVAGPMSGPVPGPIEAVGASNGSSCGNFCSSLKTVGKLYKNSSNPYIQEVSIFGRAQFQYADVEAENAAGVDVSQDFEEVRRARLGMKVKAFNGLELVGRANMINDKNATGGDRDWGYKDFDEAYAAYKFGNVLGFDDLKLKYGRLKVAVGHESHTSSKKIKTVERSALSNKIYRKRYTGFMASGKRGNIAGTVGVLSLDKSDFVGNWDAGTALYGSTTLNLMGNDVLLDAVYNLDEGSVDDQVGLGYKFAFSAATEKELYGWNVMANAVYGHNGDNTSVGAGDGGSFWGLVVMPSKFIVEDKVEAVFRYQYQGSSKSNGVSANKRYFGNTIGNPTGDQHHSIYSGLNYFFCGHNSKLMAGVEYETLDTPAGDASGTTFWAAYRMYF